MQTAAEAANSAARKLGRSQPSNEPTQERGNGSTTNTEAKEAEKDRLKTFWGHMAQMYPQWTEKYGDKPTPLWGHLLKALSMQEQRKGLKACFESQDRFTPTIQTFRERCRPSRSKRPEHQYPSDQERMAMLPRPNSNPERARIEIGRIKAQLMGRGKAEA